MTQNAHKHTVRVRDQCTLRLRVHHTLTPSPSSRSYRRPFHYLYGRLCYCRGEDFTFGFFPLFVSSYARTTREERKILEIRTSRYAGVFSRCRFFYFFASFVLPSNSRHATFSSSPSLTRKTRNRREKRKREMGLLASVGCGLRHRYATRTMGYAQFTNSPSGGNNSWVRGSLSMEISCEPSTEMNASEINCRWGLFS